MKRNVSVVIMCQIVFSLLLGCSNGGSKVLNPSVSAPGIQSPDSSLPPTTINTVSPSPTELVPLKILSMIGKNGWALDKESLLITKNSGSTWNKVLPTGISTDETLIDASFKDNVIGFAIYFKKNNKPKLQTAHQTMDGGGNLNEWEIADLPTKEDWEISPDVKPYVFLGYYNNTSKGVLLTSSPGAGLMNKSLFLTDDDGKSWNRVADITDQIMGYPNGFTFRNPKEGWITSTYHGQKYIPFYRTKDGGVTWEIQTLVAPDKFKKAYANTYEVVFDQENDRHGIVTVEFIQDGKKTLIPYETIDNGATWNPIQDILPNLQEPPVFHFNDIIEGRAVSLDGSSLYIMSYNKTIWKTVLPNISLREISQIYLENGGFGWFFEKGKIMITSDGGKTWTKP